MMMLVPIHRSPCQMNNYKTHYGGRVGIQRVQANRSKENSKRVMLELFMVINDKKLSDAQCSITWVLNIDKVTEIKRVCACNFDCLNETGLRYSRHFHMNT